MAGVSGLDRVVGELDRLEESPVAAGPPAAELELGDALELADAELELGDAASVRVEPRALEARGLEVGLEEADDRREESGVPRDRGLELGDAIAAHEVTRIVSAAARSAAACFEV